MNLSKMKNKLQYVSSPCVRIYSVLTYPHLISFDYFDAQHGEFDLLFSGTGCIPCILFCTEAETREYQGISPRAVWSCVQSSINQFFSRWILHKSLSNSIIMMDGFSRLPQLLPGPLHPGLGQVCPASTLQSSNTSEMITIYIHLYTWYHLYTMYLDKIILYWIKSVIIPWTYINIYYINRYILYRCPSGTSPRAFRQRRNGSASFMETLPAAKTQLAMDFKNQCVQQFGIRRCVMMKILNVCVIIYTYHETSHLLGYG